MTQFLPPAAANDFDGVIVDCRFSLADADAGHQAYAAGHIPRAVFVDVARDLSRLKGKHGGRHPLPDTHRFAERLAALGIGPETQVLLDDSNYLFAARCWWMLRALGYREPDLLAGGYAAWLASGGAPTQLPAAHPALPPAPVPADWPLRCDREQLAELQGRGATLVDAREAGRYRGEFEPLDPVAGHIPGAVNLPWQSFIDAQGHFIDEASLKALWEPYADASPLVMYCGSGISACVNILSLAQLGRDDVWLYGGSWSDWCSYLETSAPR